MSTTINNAAIIPAKQARLEVTQLPFPTPGPDEVIIRNRAAAVNPADYVVQTMGIIITKYPAVIGYDAAGDVVAVGSTVSQQGRFKVGDRVLGASDWSTFQESRFGTFQEYVVLTTPLVTLIPEGTTYEQAAVLPLAVSTAGQGLFTAGWLDLPLPQASYSSSAKDTKKTIVIAGGASSVGATAIQLAVAAGIRVFTTASPKNHAFCRSLGASQVFDYRDEGHFDAMIKALKDEGAEVQGAMDAIGNETNTRGLCRLLGATNGRKVLANAQFNMEQYASDGVDIQFIQAPQMIKSDVGRYVWGEFLGQALASGKFKCKPDPRVVGKGVGAVQDALDAWKAGVSAEKIVVSL